MPQSLRLIAHIFKIPEPICTIFGRLQHHVVPNT